MFILAASVVTTLLAADAPPVVHHTEGAPSYVIADGKGRARLLLDEGKGGKEASVTLLELDAGAAVPEHVHDGSAEILYIQKGAVEMIVDGKPVQASQGDVVRIPAGVKHSAKVVGKETLQAVQIYVGPGPEQRFTKGTPTTPVKK